MFFEAYNLMPVPFSDPETKIQNSFGIICWPTRFRNYYLDSFSKCVEIDRSYCRVDYSGSHASYLDIATSIFGRCIFLEPITAPVMPAAALGIAVIAMTCERLLYILGKMSLIDKLG
jgi:hypothetical protein